MRRTETRRRYDDACGTAHGLELVGDRWALLVARELMFGPRRFVDLKRDLKGISANVLSERLDGLLRTGVIQRLRLPPPASVMAYALTPWGAELEPVIVELGRWAARSPGHDPRLPLSAASIMLSLRAMFRPERAVGVAATLAFHFGDERFIAHVSPRGVETRRAGDTDGPDATVTGTPESVAAWLYGGQTRDALEAAEVLALDGDPAAAAAFAGCFALPPKAGTGG